MIKTGLLLGASMLLGAMGMFREPDENAAQMDADPRASCFVDPAEGTVLAFENTENVPDTVKASLRAAYPDLKMPINFTEQFKMAQADVNEDGKPDYFVQHNNSFYCGSGGCNVDVLIKTKTGYRLSYALFKGSGYVLMLPEMHLGMYTLLVKQGAESDSYTKYHWDGKQYQDVVVCEF